MNKDINLGTEEFVLEGKHFSGENQPTETDPRAFLNHGDEIKNLLQAAVSRAIRSGISCQLLL